jgi:tRNA (guanosine-2'-O-)-methyltransferase
MKYRVLSSCVAVALGAWALSGCVVRGQGGIGVQSNITVPAPVVTVPTITANVSVPTGVTVIEQQCIQGSAEQCNGLDDNCNGVIDEGCGYQTGNIQVTAAWNSSSDIDLHVIDPMNEEIYYAHRNSSSGGVLDRDANAACSVAPPTVENVYWSAQPPPGTYRIRLVAYDMCRTAATPVTLSIAVGGRIVGAYSFTFTYDRQEFVLPFTI